MAESRLTDRAPPAVVTNTTPPLRASRLPPHLRLPILLVLNLGISSVLYSSTSKILPHELATVSRKTDEGDFVTPAARLIYKIIFITAGWYLKYDWLDTLALTAITNAPFAYLLATYYEISPLNILAFVGNDILAMIIPIYLMRPASAINNPSVPLKNRYLLNSPLVNISTAMLAVSVYVALLFGALKFSWLNLFLIKHFDLKTLEGAHNETVFSLINKLVTAGIATKTFLLNPSIGAQPEAGAATPVEEFDGATASLPQTVKHNIWNFSRRTRTLIERTAILSVFLFARTVTKCMTLNSWDFVGASGYAGLWIVANVICAGWWAWVGDAEA